MNKLRLGLVGFLKLAQCNELEGRNYRRRLILLQLLIGVGL